VIVLRLYNSKTREKEVFKPLEKNKVSIYVCGITPYDTTHLGHAFTYIFFDVLVRYLTFSGYKVNYTQNVTDIDDDILKKAKEEKTDYKKLGDFWTKIFLSDMKSLNVLSPTHLVKATDSVDKMIVIINGLLKNGYAYKNGGNIYFEVDKFKKYGELSKFNKKQMILISKERGGNPNDPLKKNPLDFILWQSANWRSKENEPSWNTPFGKGRPGWHIECSAMANKYLGGQIDIHGGGKDLIFPHHENEITQSESYTGKSPFVKYWMHTAMVLESGEKMSKSLGNLVMIGKLLLKYSPNAIRWMILSHYYRHPWEFEEKELQVCEEYIRKVSIALEQTNKVSIRKIKTDVYLKDFICIMNDDLDTPKVLELILKIANKILKEKNKSNIKELQEVLKKIIATLGFKL